MSFVAEVFELFSSFNKCLPAVVMCSVGWLLSFARF